MSEAHTLTRNLGGKWYRAYGSAPCPVCQIEDGKSRNALTIADGAAGRLLLSCKKSGCDFGAILRAAGLVLGSCTSADPQQNARCVANRKAEKVKREARAYRLWQESLPIVGTIAETYLRNRAITCELPDKLRFHPEAWHGPTATKAPALVALVEGGDDFAVHCTYLLPSGLGKASFHPNKAMLGAVDGGAVRLSEAQGTLVVAEGIETGLSLACGLLSAPATIWAALSTSGVRSLRLPTRPGKLTIAADGDSAGRVAAQVLAERAHAMGWATLILNAPQGRDWNDILFLKGRVS